MVARADEVQSSRENQRECLKVKGINHQETYGLDGARTGMVEEYVCLRCAEAGIQRNVSGSYPFRYLAESQCQEPGVPNDAQVNPSLRPR